MNITAYRPFLDGEGSIREMREWETDSFARDAKLKDFRQHFSSYYTIHTFQADGLRVDWVTENGKVFQWYTQAQPAMTAVPAPVVPLGDWMRNPDAFDPSAIMRTVEADGTLYTLHSVMGEGWPVCIRKSGYGHVGMADWNDMAGVRRAIDAHNAKQA